MAQADIRKDNFRTWVKAKIGLRQFALKKIVFLLQFNDATNAVKMF